MMFLRNRVWQHMHVSLHWCVIQFVLVRHTLYLCSCPIGTRGMWFNFLVYLNNLHWDRIWAITPLSVINSLCISTCVHLQGGICTVYSLYIHSLTHAYWSSGSLYPTQRVECIVVTPGSHFSDTIGSACMPFFYILSSSSSVKLKATHVILRRGRRWKFIYDYNAPKMSLF